MPLPPLSEQRRIVAEVESRRAATARLRAALQAQLAVLAVLVSRSTSACFGTTSLPVSYGPELRSGYVRLLDLAKLETGHTPSRNHPEWWNGDIRWLALPDIRAVDGRRVCETSETINADGIANSSARVLPAGSVAFSRTASVGFVTILGRNMAVSQDFAVWVCGADLDPDWLMLALRTSRDHLLTASAGAIHKTIYMDHLRTFRVNKLPLEAQKRIVEVTRARQREIDESRSALLKQLRDLDAFDQAVLREAFQ
jgi:type I restriction enzyme S subunit